MASAKTRYYEINQPYFAVIGARNKFDAIKYYHQIVAEKDPSYPDEVLENISRIKKPMAMLYYKTAHDFGNCDGMYKSSNVNFFIEENEAINKNRNKWLVVVDKSLV